MTADGSSVGIVDPRAIRVTVKGTTTTEVAPIVVAPPAEAARDVRVDNEAVSLALERIDRVHAVVIEGHGDVATRHPVIMLPFEPTAGPAFGVARREVIVDGWRIEVFIESERRASLRERARRGAEASARGGPTEVRAIIPGRVVSVSIVPGDPVVAGQRLLVIEAMKMQNELLAPRDGVIVSLAVGAGQTIDVGDLLLVLE